MKHASLTLIALLALGGGHALADPQHYSGYGYDDYGYVDEYDSYDRYSQDRYRTSYRGDCRNIQKQNTITGAVLGGIAGGVIGNEVAARGVRTEGRVLGALVGAVTGSQIGRQNVDCDPVRYGPDRVYQTGYRDGAYRYDTSNDWRHDDLYGGRNDNSEVGHSPENMQDCQTVMRITTLPDGREIHEPVLACRDMQYGPWSVRND